MTNFLFLQFLTFLFGLFYSICCLDHNSPCYYPNGTDSKFSIVVQSPDGDIFKPCFPGNDGHSMCCRPTDKCTHDGTCESPFDGLHWRGTCSDPSWKSQDCLKLCINGFLNWTAKYVDQFNDPRMANNVVPMTQCPDKSYCCGEFLVAEECCRKKKGQSIMEGGSLRDEANTATAVVPTSTLLGDSRISTTASLLSIETTLVTAATTAAAIKASGRAMNTATIVGATIGIFGGTAALAIGFWLMVRYRIRRRRSSAPPEIVSTKRLSRSHQWLELPDRPRPFEAQDSATYELHGNQTHHC